MSRDMLYIILAQTLGSIITTIMTKMAIQIGNILQDVYKYYLGVRGYRYYQAIKKTNLSNYYVYGGRNDVYDAIDYYISKHISIQGSADIDETHGGYVIKPIDYLVHQDIIFIHYSWNETLDTDKIKLVVTNKRYTIFAKNNSILDEFIKKVRTNYSNKKLKYSRKQRYYTPTSIDSQYNAQKILGFTTMDSLHFPAKDSLLNQLDKLNNGGIEKLNLMLSGTPGCGKTSIISAIAEMTGRNIIEVNLNLFKSSEQLFSLFFEETITTNFDGLQMNICIPNNQRIMVIEEIDTADQIVNERKRTVSSPVADNKNDKLNDKKKLKNKKSKKNPNISLGDLLVIFDGIRKTTGMIIIMTTNHYDKLDSALKRSGRVNKHIELKPCLVVDAIRMIMDKVPDYKTEDYPFNDYAIDPATLGACLQQMHNNMTIEELNDLMRIEIENKNKAIADRKEYEEALAKAKLLNKNKKSKDKSSAAKDTSEDTPKDTPKDTSEG